MYDLNTENLNKSAKLSPPAMSSSLNVFPSLAELLLKRVSEKKHFFGIEVSPSSRNDILDYSQFGSKQPSFVSITWLMDTNLQCDRMSDAPAIQLSHAMGNEIPVLSHVTCFKLDESRLNDILDNGIHNVFALKGDSGCEEQQWKYAAQLVAAIRSRKPSVTIGVAGYPESYRLASDMLSDLRNLKSKIDAGADFIITNVCFSLDHLLEYIRLCRQHNILVPIIPGIYVPSSYGELIKMSELSKFRIPNEHLAVYHRYHSDNDAFQAFAIDNAVSLISQIFENNSENVYGIHFFTMNKYENIRKVVGKIKEFQ